MYTSVRLHSHSGITVFCNLILYCCRWAPMLHRNHEVNHSWFDTKLINHVVKHLPTKQVFWVAAQKPQSSCNKNIKFGVLILRCVIPVVLSNNKNKLNGTYVYRHKHNYIPCSTFTFTKVQLHVSATPLTVNSPHM